MNPANPPKTPRMLLATATLLALSIGLGLTLTQCKMVTDGLATGTRVAEPEKASSCIAKCAKAYADSARVEEALHERNEEACNDIDACEQKEDARHAAAERRIRLGRKDCQNHCHHQGGGGGGQ